MGIRDKIASFWVRPQVRDLTKEQSLSLFAHTRRVDGGAAGNTKLLTSIYKGSNTSFGLSSYIAHPIVNIPKMLVGIPTVTLDAGEAQGQSLIDKLTPILIDEGSGIIKEMLLTGTCWVFPKWSARLMRLIWEVIPDNAIRPIIDKETNEIVEVWTDEQLEVPTDATNSITLERKRHITQSLITDWIGTGQEATYTNSFGIIPIPFGHDCLLNEWRGNSVYAPIAQLLKDTNDIAYNRDEILAEFSPKLSITGIKDVNTWIGNQKKMGSFKDGKFDTMRSMVFVGGEGEAVTMIGLPSDYTQSHTNALTDNERKIMMSSGMPQLFFGQLSTGTQAANDAQVHLAVEAITDIRNETVKAYNALINNSLDILAFMGFTTTPKVKVEYGHFNLMSAQQRAATVASLSSAFSTMMAASGLTPALAKRMIEDMYPDLPAQTEQQIISGAKEWQSQLGPNSQPDALEIGDIN